MLLLVLIGSLVSSVQGFYPGMTIDEILAAVKKQVMLAQLQTQLATAQQGALAAQTNLATTQQQAATVALKAQAQNYQAQTALQTAQTAHIINTINAPAQIELAKTKVKVQQINAQDEMMEFVSKRRPYQVGRGYDMTQFSLWDMSYDGMNAQMVLGWDGSTSAGWELFPRDCYNPFQTSCSGGVKTEVSQYKDSQGAMQSIMSYSNHQKSRQGWFTAKTYRSAFSNASKQSWTSAKQGVIAVSESARKCNNIIPSCLQAGSPFVFDLNKVLQKKIETVYKEAGTSSDGRNTGCLWKWRDEIIKSWGTHVITGTKNGASIKLNKYSEGTRSGTADCASHMICSGGGWGFMGFSSSSKGCNGGNACDHSRQSSYDWKFTCSAIGGNAAYGAAACSQQSGASTFAQFMAGSTDKDQWSQTDTVIGIDTVRLDELIDDLQISFVIDGHERRSDIVGTLRATLDMYFCDDRGDGWHWHAGRCGYFAQGPAFGIAWPSNTEWLGSNRIRVTEECPMLWENIDYNTDIGGEVTADLHGRANELDCRRGCYQAGKASWVWRGSDRRCWCKDGTDKHHVGGVSSGSTKCQHEEDVSQGIRGAQWTCVQYESWQNNNWCKNEGGRFRLTRGYNGEFEGCGWCGCCRYNRPDPVPGQYECDWDKSNSISGQEGCIGAGHPYYLTLGDNHGFDGCPDGCNCCKQLPPDEAKPRKPEPYDVTDCSMGGSVLIKSHRNEYLEDSDGTVGLRPDTGVWQQWTLEDAHDDGQVFIKSHRNEYLEDRDGKVGLSSDRGNWQKWTMIYENGQILFKSHRNVYLEDRDDTAGVYDEMGNWQMWTVTRDGANVCTSHPPLKGSCKLRKQLPDNEGCFSLKSKEDCLTSLDGRSGDMKTGVLLKGQLCVWCPDGCQDGSDTQCEPKDWLEVQGNKKVYQTCLFDPCVGQKTSMKACFTTSSRDDCLSSLDSRDGDLYGASCVWCPNECVYGNAAKCEPRTWVDKQSGKKPYEESCNADKCAKRNQLGGDMGCHDLNDRKGCLTSLDGRKTTGIYGSACVWCPDGCTTDNSDPQCDTKSYVDAQDNKKGYESCLDDPCPRAALGDVKLSDYPRGKPSIFINDQWRPICGHWFWNNNNGATTLCKKLGYTSGTQEHAPDKLKTKSYNVGECGEGEALTACSKGGNERQITDCTEGVYVTCVGDVQEPKEATCDTNVCAQGDVKLSAYPSGTPYIFMDNAFRPICGHWFWNNNNGATTLCKKLGYTSGTQQSATEPYTTDSYEVGSCKEGEELTACSDGGNMRKISDCHEGVTVTCVGNVQEPKQCPEAKQGRSVDMKDERSMLGLGALKLFGSALTSGGKMAAQQSQITAVDMTPIKTGIETDRFVTANYMNDINLNPPNMIGWRSVHETDETDKGGVKHEALEDRVAGLLDIVKRLRGSIQDEEDEF